MPKVGDTIWRFDLNRRVYARDARGREFGAPIWREHWQPVKIKGETRVSWLTPYGKCPKKGAHGWAFSTEEIERAAFVSERRRLAERVHRCLHYDTLKAIEAALDAAPKEPQLANTRLAEKQSPRVINVGF